jgi:hypothetical protein
MQTHAPGRSAHACCRVCVCMIAAATGMAAITFFGIGVASTLLAMLVEVATLRLSRLHVPPSLAVALLPQVIPHVDWYFPLAVGIGSALLTLSFLTFRKLGLSRLQTNSMAIK